MKSFGSSLKEFQECFRKVYLYKTQNLQFLFLRKQSIKTDTSRQTEYSSMFYNWSSSQHDKEIH